MSQATFHLLPITPSLTAIDSLQLFACQLAALYYQQNLEVYIHCDDKTQAHAIDELLWQFDANSFVAHNLKGEGPQTGAPVEIGFDRLGPNKKRAVLINLADQSPAFAVDFGKIDDFVASDDSLKAFARERYKQYRMMGIALSTRDLATEPLNLV